MEEPSIGELPDDLILKILPLLPFYKEDVATHLLAKRWEDPWELVPDLMFDDGDQSFANFVKFMLFIYGSLLFDKPQTLERLHLKLNRDYSASGIYFLVKLAVNRSVRKLRIQTFGKTLVLPSCLSTCVTLMSLILNQVKIKVVPSCFRLPSLKSLHLFSVKFSGFETLESFLQSCPGLEYLVVKNVLFKSVLPWCLLSKLKSLYLLSSSFWKNESVASLLRICPVLEDLVVNQTKVFSSNVPYFDHMQKP